MQEWHDLTSVLGGQPAALRGRSDRKAGAAAEGQVRRQRRKPGVSCCGTAEARVETWHHDAEGA